jgi:hypothetical protein
MTAHALSRARTRRGKTAVLTRPFLVVLLTVAAAVGCVSYLLWPTWPNEPPALDVPALPVTVGGVLFEVPPAAIRAKLQRQAGQHERIDLVFRGRNCRRRRTIAACATIVRSTRRTRRPRWPRRKTAGCS